VVLLAIELYLINTRSFAFTEWRTYLVFGLASVVGAYISIVIYYNVALKGAFTGTKEMLDICIEILKDVQKKGETQWFSISPIFGLIDYFDSMFKELPNPFRMCQSLIEQLELREQSPTRTLPILTLASLKYYIDCSNGGRAYEGSDLYEFLDLYFRDEYPRRRQHGWPNLYTATASYHHSAYEFLKVVDRLVMKGTIEYFAINRALIAPDALVARKESPILTLLVAPTVSYFGRPIMRGTEAIFEGEKTVQHATPFKVIFDLMRKNYAPTKLRPPAGSDFQPRCSGTATG